MPAEQVAHERLAADEKLVRHDVPRSDQDASCFNRLAQPRFLLRPDLEVILEHDRLSVEMEVFVGRILVQQIEQAIDECDEAEPELLVGQVPLPIPVCVRNDVNIQHGH
jgi:hypothetical protein